MATLLYRLGAFCAHRRLLVLVVCVALAARIGWVGYGPRAESELVRQQVGFLQGSLAAGGASRIGCALARAFPSTGRSA